MPRDDCPSCILGRCATGYGQPDPPGCRQKASERREAMRDPWVGEGRLSARIGRLAAIGQVPPPPPDPSGDGVADG
jgi:hypothetical protein